MCFNSTAPTLIFAFRESTSPIILKFLLPKCWADSLVVDRPRFARLHATAYQVPVVFAFLLFVAYVYLTGAWLAIGSFYVPYGTDSTVDPRVIACPL